MKEAGAGAALGGEEIEFKHWDDYNRPGIVLLFSLEKARCL
jgi:hypothetical protein